MSLMLFPCGRCIPSVLVTLPLWMLTSAHFSTPDSILMSPETVLTVWAKVSISVVPLPNSLMSSMNIWWLILLPPFSSWYPSSILFRTLVIGIITTMKSSGDGESPWKIPLLMLTSANLVPELVRIVFNWALCSWGMWWCFLLHCIFPGILSAMSVVQYHVEGLLIVCPCHTQVGFSSLAVHHHHFVSQQVWCLCTSFYNLSVGEVWRLSLPDSCTAFHWCCQSVTSTLLIGRWLACNYLLHFLYSLSFWTSAVLLVVIHCGAWWLLLQCWSLFCHSMM